MENPRVDVERDSAEDGEVIWLIEFVQENTVAIAPVLICFELSSVAN